MYFKSQISYQLTLPQGLNITGSYPPQSLISHPRKSFLESNWLPPPVSYHEIREVEQRWSLPRALSLKIVPQDCGIPLGLQSVDCSWLQKQESQTLGKKEEVFSQATSQRRLGQRLQILSFPTECGTGEE